MRKVLAMKLRQLLLLLIWILIVLLSTVVLFGFSYEKDPYDPQEITLISEKGVLGKRGMLVSTKDLNVGFRNGRDQISFLRLSNDHRPYLLTIPEGLDYRSWGITMIGHFENVVGKDSYLTYDPFPHTLLTWWKKYFNFLLDPSSFYFDSQNTACRRFNDEKRCFFNGKLKERILRVVSDPTNVYVVQID